MLVLSRKASEKINIGENITIEVRRVAGNRVTLAIDAPRDIRILRGELEKVAKEFEEASPAAERETGSYVASHDSVSLTTPLGAEDMSDHGLAAYAIS